MHAEFRFDDNFTPVRIKLRRAFLQLTNIDFQKNPVPFEKQNVPRENKLKWFCTFKSVSVKAHAQLSNKHNTKTPVLATWKKELVKFINVL